MSDKIKIGDEEFPLVLVHEHPYTPCTSEDSCVANGPLELTIDGKELPVDCEGLELSKGNTPTYKVMRLCGRPRDEHLTVQVREEVEDFAQVMERKLLVHDNKGHWSSMSISELLGLLRGEIDELEEAIKSGNNCDVAKEAADVANYCMMIHDNHARLLGDKND